MTPLRDRLSEFIWRGGIAIMILYVAWVNTAPYIGETPEWWDPNVAQAVGYGTVLVFVGVMSPLAIAAIEFFGGDEA